MNELHQTPTLSASAEHELRWRLNPDELRIEIDNVPLEDVELLSQHYLGYENEDAELRVRHSGIDPPVMTLKFGKEPHRLELETELDPALERFYLEQANGVVEKLRCHHDGETHVDIITSPAVGFGFMEREFASAALLQEFRPEDGYEDVTGHLNTRHLANLPECRPAPDQKAAIDEAIARKLELANRPVVVAVAGKTASGKSTLAQELADEHNGAIISLDNYNRGKTTLNTDPEFAREHNWDLVQVYDHKAASRHLQALRDGESVTVPQFSFVTAEPHPTGTQIKPSPLIIVEGLYALHHQVALQSDLTIEVVASLPTRLKRRVLRDIERTSWTPQEIFEYCVKTAEPTYARYERHADLLTEPDLTLDTTLQ